MRRRKSLFWARRGVCDEFFYSCRQTNGKALFIARKYHAMPCHILGGRNLVRVRNVVVATIFDFMTVEDWGE